MSPTLSVIIPTYHAPKLNQTLTALAPQCDIDQVVEILVVGQQDLDDLIPCDKLVYTAVKDRPTPARNRNAGARQASADYLCFTDSDCIPSPDWIINMLNSLVDEPIAVAGAVDIPSQMPYWGKCDHYLGFENQVAGIADQRWLNYAATNNFCIQKGIFDALDGFDESYSKAGGEDRDFCWRLQSAGYLIKYAPQAVVFHQHPRGDFRSAWNHLYHYGQVTAQFRINHHQESGLTWRWGRLAVKYPIAGEFLASIRVILRGLARPIRQPVNFRFFRYQPGIMILDFAHSLGMIDMIRSHES